MSLCNHGVDKQRNLVKTIHAIKFLTCDHSCSSPCDPKNNFKEVKTCLSTYYYILVPVLIAPPPRMQPLFLMRWSLQVANTLGSQLLDMRKNGAMESQKIMQGYSHYKKRLLGGHSSTNGTEETQLSGTMNKARFCPFEPLHMPLTAP